MKSCPICSETYSERIDFCFSDGAVLALVPSAMDAPVPRRATARAVDSAPPKLSSESSEPVTSARALAEAAAVEAAALDLPAPVPVAVVPEAPPAPAPPPPAAEDLPAERTEPTMIAPAAAVAVVRQAPEPVAAPLYEAPAPPPRKGSMVPWVLGLVAVAAAAGVLLGVLISAPSAPPEAPTPVVAASLPAAAPQPPVEAPAAVASAPAPVEQPVPPTAPATPRSAAPNAPTPKPVTSTGRSEVVVRNTPIVPPVGREGQGSPPPRPARPAPEAPPAAGPSPWDSPTAPQEATLTLSSDPPGAVVRIDDKLVGATPRQVRVPFGVHEIEFTKEGYRTEVRRPDVRASSLTIPVELTPVQRIGTVVVAAYGWEGSQLFVDGKAAGTLPASLQLSEGLHLFELRREGASLSERQVVKLLDKGITRVNLKVP